MENHPEKQEQNPKQQQSSSSKQMNRNLIERNRRSQMKDLLSTLFSLVPLQHPKFSMCDSVEQATTYIRKLEEKIEKLRERKEVIQREGDNNDDQKLEPVLTNIISSESTLEVRIISGLKKKFLLHQAMSVLVEEGAEIVNVTYHNAGDRVFHTISSKAFCTRIGIDTSRVEERLKKLIS